MPILSVIPKYEINILKRSAVGQLNFNLGLSGIPEQWRISQGEGIKIGVLDTGVPNHRDLDGKIAGYKNFTNDSSPFDTDGHSTGVCGIIAAEMRGETGCTGIAPKAQLYVGKVLNDSGVGKDSWLAAGIKWCVDEGCHIINMSTGAPAAAEKKFKQTKDAVVYAASKGVFMFAAAGNDDSQMIDLPARWNEAFCIVAIDKLRERAHFSNSGPEVDFAALGVDVVSTFLNNQYASVSGTSFAAPTAAGIGALVLAPSPTKDWWEFRARLIRLTTSLGEPPWNQNYGFGNIVFGQPNNPVDPYTKEYGIVLCPQPCKSWWEKLMFWK